MLADRSATAEPGTPPLDATAYLARIGYAGTVASTAEALRGLHLAHLLAVPFENLDIPLGRPIRLEPAALFDKIVRRRRGGFCFELNGLFALLLESLGFGVARLAAQFPREPGEVAPEFDHLTLLVSPADRSGPWLADVGAGRGSFVEPLRAGTTATQRQLAAGAGFRVVPEGDRTRLLRREPNGDWERQYLFSSRRRALAEFADGCRHHQTSPASPFTRGRICSLATPTGRITLAERRLIETIDGARSERELSEWEYRDALRDRFGIDLDR